MSEGWIYILINPSMKKDLLKIGKTTGATPEQRAKQLSTTGVPAEYHVAYEVKVPDCEFAERVLYERLAAYRFTPNREFFKLPLKQAIDAVAKILPEVASRASHEIGGSPPQRVEAIDAQRTQKTSRIAEEYMDNNTINLAKAVSNTQGSRSSAYDAGVRTARTLTDGNIRYINGINRHGYYRQTQTLGRDDEGVTVVIQSFQKGASIEEVVRKLITLSAWRDKRLKAERYVKRMIGELKSKINPCWYGWLLTKKGEKYFVRHGTPAEICFYKFGDDQASTRLSNSERGVYLKEWFEGLLSAIRAR